jgi:hypothetical protein
MDRKEKKNIDSLRVCRSRTILLIQSDVLHLAVAKSTQWVWGGSTNSDNESREGMSYKRVSLSSRNDIT